MYGSGIIPLAIAPTNQYGIGLYGVGPYGMHALLHATSPQLPGFGQMGQPFGMQGLGQPGQFGINPILGQPQTPFGMLPGLGQPGQPFGQPVQPFGQPMQPFGQPMQPFGPYGQMGIGQPGPVMPNVGGRQLMRVYVPSAVGIVPIDIVI